MRIPVHIRRHKAFQTGLTLGVICCCVAQLFEVSNFLINVSQTIVTVIWLWEQ